MRKLLIALLILSLAGCLTGCPKVDLKPYWDAFQAWNDEYNQPKPPDPVPDPIPIPEPIPDVPPKPPNGAQIGGPLIVCDLATLPERMRADGILLGDSSIWYGVACAWAGHGWSMTNEVVPIYEARDRIQVWFEALIQQSVLKLRDNPTWTATAIANDGRDRCGFIIGPAIMERFKEFGDRVQPGTWVPESEY